MEADEAEKVYVTVGNDQKDNFKTLEWALRRWSSQSIHIVILFVSDHMSRDLVYGPFGKLPASSVSEEMLEVLKKTEQEKVDNLLSKYVAFCGKAEVVKVEKYDEPIHKLLVDLISGLHITKLVMGLSFLRSSSSWKSKTAISRSFYVDRNKPDYCKLSVICRGRLVHLRGDSEEGIMEDDQGVMVAKLKEKSGLKVWFGKMFNSGNSPEQNFGHTPLSRIADSLDLQSLWEQSAGEIDDYFQELLLLYKDDDNLDEHATMDDTTSLIRSNILEGANSSMSAAEKIEVLERKIDQAHQTIKLKREEAKANEDRHSKAEQTISLCNQRIEDLEKRIKEEVATRVGLERDSEVEKEKLYDLMSEIEESKNKLNSLAQLQSELSSKLQTLNLAKAHAEAQLEKAVIARAEMVREIEELRRQRDVIHRRVEFCKEKEAIEVVNRSNEPSCGYREYTEEEIRSATDNFSERLLLKPGGDWTNVYRGRINHATIVAVKMLSSVDWLSLDDFQKKMKLLSQVRHPHLVSVIGFCSKPKCIMFEYMHCGSLREILNSPDKKPRRCNRPLWWHNRIQVAYDVSLGLGYLHSAKPQPIIHGDLTTSNVLLDRNLTAKITYCRIPESNCYDNTYVCKDIQAFGALLVQLLTGRNWTGLVEEAMKFNPISLVEVLDKMAGQWPLDLAAELAGIALRCLSTNSESAICFDVASLIHKLEDMTRSAQEILAKAGSDAVINQGLDRDELRDVPNMFICPIFRDVMRNPHVAADGFSYELKAIEEWLRTGHETSPMTNLRLAHKLLTPNHTLRSFFLEWQSKRGADAL